MFNSAFTRWTRSDGLRCLGLTFACTLILAGCQTAQYPEIQQTGSLRAFRAADHHPTVVEPSEVQLEIELPGYTRGLSPRQVNQVRQFLANFRSLGEGELVFTVPSGTANEASAHAGVNKVRNLITQARIAKTAVRYVPYRGTGAGAEPPIILSFERYCAKPSECGPLP